jgi:hypothetical protein
MPSRKLLLLVALVTTALSGCGQPTGSPAADGASSGTRTITVAPTPTITPPQPAPTPPTTVSPPAPPPTTAGQTGIVGVTVTTRCPVVTEEGCPALPVRTHVVLSTMAGATMSTMDTGSDGRFTFAVGAGTYIVHVNATSGALPRPTQVTVTVHSGQTAAVTITMDSGIR